MRRKLVAFALSLGFFAAAYSGGAVGAVFSPVGFGNKCRPADGTPFPAPSVQEGCGQFPVKGQDSHTEPRRRKLHIPRFPAGGKAHSFRCSSSSSRTRFAGLRLDWRTERKSERRTNSTRLTTNGKARSFCCSSAPNEPACAGPWPDGETIPSFFHGKREKDKTTTIVLLGFSSAGKRREYFIRRGG